MATWSRDLITITKLRNRNFWVENGLNFPAAEIRLKIRGGDLRLQWFIYQMPWLSTFSVESHLGVLFHFSLNILQNWMGISWSNHSSATNPVDIAKVISFEQIPKSCAFADSKIVRTQSLWQSCTLLRFNVCKIVRRHQKSN